MSGDAKGTDAMRQLLAVVSGGFQAIGAALVVAILFAVAVCYFPTVGCVIAVRVMLSKLFPRSWPIDWDKSLQLDPARDAVCPRCAGPLTPGVVDKYDNIGGLTQAATCAACGHFRRTGNGKVWHGWGAASQEP